MNFKKEYVLKERSLLSVSTSPEVESLSSLNFALNEVSVNRKNTASNLVSVFAGLNYLNTLPWSETWQVSSETLLCILFLFLGDFTFLDLTETFLRLQCCI